MTVDEIASGIHRIESDLGVRFMAQYLLVGGSRSLLIDTGIGQTPDEALIPALEQLNIEPDVIAISHADLDHSGGNRRMHERYPDALLACHELDRPWIASNAAMLEQNYLWYEDHGFDPVDDQERGEMLELLGGDAPIDLGLSGGETFGLSDDFRVEVLHLPGHTLGHIGFWDADRRIAIIIDAALSDGIYDRAGNKLIPPRYYDAEAYRDSIRRIRELDARAAADRALPADVGPRGPGVLRHLPGVRRLGRGGGPRIGGRRPDRAVRGHPAGRRAARPVPRVRQGARRRGALTPGLARRRRRVRAPPTAPARPTGSGGRPPRAGARPRSRRA